MAQMKNAYRITARKPEGKRPREDPGLGRRIILKL
jgi:hypothetical protein